MNFKRVISTRLLLPILIGVFLLSAATSFLCYHWLEGIDDVNSENQRTAVRISHVLVNSLEYSRKENLLIDSNDLLDVFIQDESIVEIKILVNEQILARHQSQGYSEVGPSTKIVQHVELRLTNGVDIAHKLSASTPGRIELAFAKPTKEKLDLTIGLLWVASGLLCVTTLIVFLILKPFLFALEKVGQGLLRLKANGQAFKIDHNEQGTNGDLIDGFNSMVARFHHDETVIDNAFQSQQRFRETVSTEIDSPLKTLETNLTSLLQVAKLDSYTKMCLTICLQACRQLLKTIESISMTIAIEKSELELECTIFDCKILIEQSLAKARLVALEKELDFDVQWEQNLKELYVYSDQAKVLKIVETLLANSLKYTEHGKISVFCSLDLKEDDSVRMTLSVQDTGGGIEAGQLERIFEPYYRVKGKDNLSLPGTGFELSIAAFYCSMMNGRISADSRQGYGSLFTIQIDLDIAN